MFDATEPKSTYLDNDTYHRLKAKLAQMVAENFDKFGTCPETEVISALGEVGGIWPESVMDDEDND
jgi:ATP-dependent phosphoenolpyruvate carboxykinase